MRGNPDLNRHVMAHGDLHRVIENTFSRSTFSKDVRHMYMDQWQWLIHYQALEGAGEVEVLPTGLCSSCSRFQKC
jgi:hypothetical protein